VQREKEEHREMEGETGDWRRARRHCLGVLTSAEDAGKERVVGFLCGKKNRRLKSEPFAHAGSKGEEFYL